MKIYTRGGDKGETDLCGPERVKKDSPRMEVCGTIDELNATFGTVIAHDNGNPSADKNIVAVIGRIQAELFEAGAEIACRSPETIGVKGITPKHVEGLEADIDRFMAGLEELDSFVLPGGSLAAARLHVSRTVCRRAERRLVTLLNEPGENVSTLLLAYFNRLSDLLFVLARAANAASGQSDRICRKSN